MFSVTTNYQNNRKSIRSSDLKSDFYDLITTTTQIVKQSPLVKPTAKQLSTRVHLPQNQEVLSIAAAL